MDMSRDDAAIIWSRLPVSRKARVRAGVTLIEAKTRRSRRGIWADRIDLDLLDMSVGYPGEGNCGCVCRQLFGDYDHGQERLGFETGSAFGFTTDPTTDESFRDLDQAWSALIAMERTR